MNAFEIWFAEEHKKFGDTRANWELQRKAYIAGLRRAAGIVHKTAKMNSAFEEAIKREAQKISEG